jgi:alkanesulfonate monooxygenase SsuD/methylene tetrahydromethanopterin reductase-like flavin-dependent oxidoreductase (luciferase family)
VRTLVGGTATPAVFEAVAEYADGWMPVGGGGIGAALPELRRAAEARGRDPGSIEVVPFGTVPNDAKLAHYLELGIAEVVLRVPSGDADQMQRSLDELAGFVPRFGNRDG